MQANVDDNKPKFEAEQREKVQQCEEARESRYNLRQCCNKAYQSQTVAL